MFEALYLPRPSVNHFHIQVCWSLWSKDHVALFKSHVHRKMSQAQGSEDEWRGKVHFKVWNSTKEQMMSLPNVNEKEGRRQYFFPSYYVVGWKKLQSFLTVNFLGPILNLYCTNAVYLRSLS